VFVVAVATPDAGGCGGSVAFSDEVRPSAYDDVRWRVGKHRCKYVGIAIPAGDIFYRGVVF
jgi:hypothetical protein